MYGYFWIAVLYSEFNDSLAEKDARKNKKTLDCYLKLYQSVNGLWS